MNQPARAPSDTRSNAQGDRAEKARWVTYLMLFRVGVVTLLLASMLVVHLLGPTPEDLARPFSIFVLALIVVAYGSTVACGLLLGRVSDPSLLGRLLIAIDLVLVSALVHSTGGAESAFVFLYSLLVIAASVALTRTEAVVAGTAAAALYLTVSILGHSGLLPPVWGQRVLPTATTAYAMGRAAVINLSAMGAVVFLASTLASQLRSAGQRLADEQARYSDLRARSDDIIRCLGSGLVTVDTALRITDFNRAASEITGIAESEAIGRPLAEVIPPLIGVEPADPGAPRVEVELTRGDGASVPVGVSVSSLTDSARRVIGRIYTFQDLTEIKRMERAVKRAERLAAVGQLAATMAHEIRNPLASISGSIELLRELARSDEDRKLFDIVVREVERLDGLVGEVLDFARPRETNRAPLDLALVLDEALEAFQRGGRAGVSVVPTIRGPVWILADAAQMRQLVWNLLRNASEAMPQGGTIRVELRLHGSTSDGKNGEAVLRVSDEGSGVPPELCEAIFEPFFTTKAHGTGLGLATVARIARDHGGTVQVEQDGPGATFTVRLPALS